MSKLIAWLAGGWINWLTMLLAVGGVLAALWFGFKHWEDALRAEGRAEVQALWDADTQARALLAAAAAEDKRVKEAQHAQDIEAERKARERDGMLVGTVLADTRSQLERLRATSATVAARAVQAGASAATGPGADGPTETSGAVFDECAGQLVELAEQTEQLGVRLRGLQAWAGSALMVCGRSDHD